ncbi:hypothetical protein HPB48_013914 [Haemaphysalis longicornis]|uniref:Uncharacterized protein n=1 Tax=Haemaphysalis longicornis TaxID=44386 RepID=A0A9J6G3T9_HAELO|nr:hypothetical protein HPB48_013914 [Haemaphysalis longicornis]
MSYGPRDCVINSQGRSRQGESLRADELIERRQGPPSALGHGRAAVFSASAAEAAAAPDLRRGGRKVLKAVVRVTHSRRRSCTLLGRGPAAPAAGDPRSTTAALYYHVLGASSLGAASLGRASLGRGHSPRRRSAASVHSAAGRAADEAYLTAAAASDPLLRKLSRKDRFSSVSSRRSILECDVTAYDLIKKYLRTPAAPDSDDDDLNSNVLLNGAKKNGSGAAVTASRPPSRQQGAKSPAVSRPPASLELWPEEPDPDYDEDSDVGLEAGRFKDLKISYSPPLVRKISAPATTRTRGEASSSTSTRRSHSCSPVRPATAASPPPTKTAASSTQPRGILKKEEGAGEEICGCRDAQRSRERDSQEATTSTRATVHVNGQGTAKRRQASAPSSVTGVVSEAAPSRRNEAAALAKVDPKYEHRGGTRSERRQLAKEDKKSPKSEPKAEQQFNTEVRVRGNQKAEVKSHPRIDVKLEHANENQSPKLDKNVALVPIGAIASFDSEPERQYSQVTGACNDKDGISVTCDLRASPSNHGTNVNVVSCTVEKGISVEVNGNHSPSSSYEDDADYEAISGYQPENIKLASHDHQKITFAAEDKLMMKKAYPSREANLRGTSGTQRSEEELLIQDSSKVECLSDECHDSDVFLQTEAPNKSHKSPEIPRSPRLSPPPLSPKTAALPEGSQNGDFNCPTSTRDDIGECKAGASGNLAENIVPNKVQADVHEGVIVQDSSTPAQPLTLPDAKPRKKIPQQGSPDIKPPLVRAGSNAGVQRAPAQTTTANHAVNEARPECPARRKHDPQRSVKGDAVKDTKSPPPPRDGKPNQERNAKPNPRDTRIYQKVGVKVLPTKAETNSDVKMSLPVEHRISRPLSPPPPIPAGPSVTRQASLGLHARAGVCRVGTPMQATALSLVAFSLRRDNRVARRSSNLDPSLTFSGGGRYSAICLTQRARKRQSAMPPTLRNRPRRLQWRRPFCKPCRDQRESVRRLAAVATAEWLSLSFERRAAQYVCRGD